MVQICTGFDEVQFEGTAKEISDRFKEFAKLLANEFVPRELSRQANERTIVGIHECLKNTLHGTHIQIEIDRLPNHTCLVTAEDVAGQDQLDPAYCGGLGEIIIAQSFGQNNYHTERRGKLFHAELLIDPDAILRAAC